MFTKNCEPKWVEIFCKLGWLVAICIALAYELNHNDWHAIIYLIVASFFSLLLVIGKARYCDLKDDYARMRQEYLTTNAENKKLIDKIHQK